MARPKTLLGAATAVALAGLIAFPTAAHAAEVELYTWVYNPVGSDAAGFATISPTDAALTFLGTDSIDDASNVVGEEVCDGVGYAIDDDGLDDAQSVLTWDIETGAVLTGPTALSIAGGTIENVVFVTATSVDNEVVLEAEAAALIATPGMLALTGATLPIFLVPMALGLIVLGGVVVVVRSRRQKTS